MINISSPKRVAVLISGNGSNLQVLIDAQPRWQSAKICGVLSNRENVFGLQRAHLANIPTAVLRWQKEKYATRQDYDYALAKLVLGWRPQLIVLAGFLHILSEPVLSLWAQQKVINLHPALPDSYIGLQVIERAYHDWQAHITLKHGVMVHEVSRELDRGSVIDTEVIAPTATDTLESFTQKMHQAEHLVLLRAVEKILAAL